MYGFTAIINIFLFQGIDIRRQIQTSKDGPALKKLRNKQLLLFIPVSGL